MRCVVLLLALSSLGCSVAPTLPPRDALAAHFAGCAKVLQGQRCVLGAQPELRIWAAVPLTFTLNDARASAQHSEREGGHLYRLSIPLQASVLSAQDARGHTFTLSLLRGRDHTARARELRGAGELDAAHASLEPLLRGADVEARADALSLRARLLLQNGRTRAARAAFGLAIEAQRRLGCDSCAAFDVLTSTYNDIVHLGDLAHARQALAGSATWPQRSELDAFLLYTRGLLALQTGDVRSAYELLDRARTAAARLDLRVDEAAAHELMAISLLRLGQFAQAQRQLQRLLRSTTNACDRARVLHNLGLSALLIGEQTSLTEAAQSFSNAERAFQEALALNSEACPMPLSAATESTGLAQLALRRGDLEQATHRLADAQQLLSEPEEQITLAHLTMQAELSLARGESALALQGFRACVLRARHSRALDAEWEATLGAARALRKLGRLGDARLAYAETEQLLDREARLAPLSLGLESLLSMRSRSHDEHIELLAELGQVREALSVARLGSRRVLAAASRIEQLSRLSAADRLAWEQALTAYQRGRDVLQQQAHQDWQLAGTSLAAQLAERSARYGALERRLELSLARLVPSQAETGLAPLIKGELLVVLHATADAVILLTAHAGVMQTQKLSVSPRGAREPLLRALGQALAPLPWDVRQVRVIASSSLEDVDVHALPMEAGALIDYVPVSYSLDLPRAVDASAPTTALVIGDPSGDLPFARDEAIATGASLRSLGIGNVEVLIGEAAGAERVRRAVPRSDLLHIGGHAVSQRQSWLNTLSLAGGTTMSVSDILTLPSVPHLVFLAGCETARSNAVGPAQSMSIAHAFVAAGSDAVIASTREVEDFTTRELTSLFYRALWTQQATPARALRSAQLELRRRHPNSDWSAFRVLTP